MVSSGCVSAGRPREQRHLPSTNEAASPATAEAYQRPVIDNFTDPHDTSMHDLHHYEDVAVSSEPEGNATV